MNNSIIDIRLTILAYISSGIFLIDQGSQLINSSIKVAGVAFLAVGFISILGQLPIRLLRQIYAKINDLFLTPLYIVSLVAFLSATISIADTTKQYSILWIIPIVSIVFLIWEIVDFTNKVRLSCKSIGKRATSLHIMETVCFISLVITLCILSFKLEPLGPPILWVTIATLAFSIYLILNRQN